MSERNFVHRIRTQDVLGVVEAIGPVGAWLIEVLVVGVGRICLRSPVTVIAAVVGHALGESVSRLVLQAVGIALLEYCLECVIFHAANGSRTRDLRDIALERRVPAEVNAGRGAGRRGAGAIREQLPL